MKKVLISMVYLASLAAMADQHEGYVQRTSQDDEGLKVTISDSIGDTLAGKKVKTIYVQNTQPDFEKLKELFETSKDTKDRLIINKDAMKTIKAMKAGK